MNTIVACIIFVFPIIYASLLFIAYTFNRALDQKMNILSYIIPLIIVVVFGILNLIAYLCSERFFQCVYYVTAILAGIEIYMIMASAVLQMILALKKIPTVLSYIILIALPLIFITFGVIWQRHIFIEEITLHYKGFQSKRKIVQLSDLHLGVIYKKDFVQRIVDKINTINPDVVVITGDLADGSYEVTAEYLSPFDTLAMPVLFITGNHEEYYGKTKFLETISKTNISYIGNEVMNYRDLNFIGVDYEYDLNKRLGELSSQFINSDILIYCYVMFLY